MKTNNISVTSQMKKVVLSLLSLLVSISTYAQTFEGILHVTSIYNLDKKTAFFSSGMGYNGNAIWTYYVKGNKVLAQHNTLQYSTLYNPDEDLVTIYCEGLGEGISLNYTEYWNLMVCFTNKKRYISIPSVTGTIKKEQTPFTLYQLSVKAENLEAFGYKSKFIEGVLENMYMGTRIETEVIPTIKISQALNLAMIYGTDIDGLPIKFRYTQDNAGSVALLGKMKNYQGVVVNEFKTDTNLDDSFFQIPSGINVKEKGVGSIHGFYKKIATYLKKNNLYPGQGDVKEVTYELDESEWDY